MLEALIARWSKFSGWRNLQAEIVPARTVGKRLEVWDPANRPASTLVVHWDGVMLRETVGRMRHWGVTIAEQEDIISLLS